MHSTDWWLVFYNLIVTCFAFTTKRKNLNNEQMGTARGDIIATYHTKQSFHLVKFHCLPIQHYYMWIMWWLFGFSCRKRLCGYCLACMYAGPSIFLHKLSSLINHLCCMYMIPIAIAWMGHGVKSQVSFPVRTWGTV